MVVDDEKWKIPWLGPLTCKFLFAEKKVKKDSLPSDIPYY